MTQSSLGELAQALEQDRATLERELTEIDLLLRQTTSEAERHEARRVQAEERVAALENDPASASETVTEARGQLLAQTRRATLMQSQLEVLAGKQRALQRFAESVERALPVLRGASEDDVAYETAAGRAAEGHAVERRAAEGRASRDVLAAQEQMRREIARQMHDGPAQSIANIALQAQIVQRLFARDPRQAEAGLSELVAMVQHALEATKSFIFDVRPMVLDDLGLVPTLRRSTSERSRRSGVPIRFESIGSDSRLDREVETALFRIIDEAVAAYLDGRPAEVVVRLDWSERGVRASVRGRPLAGPEDVEAQARAALAVARRDQRLPTALAQMIHDEEEGARVQALPEGAWAEIRQRASTLGIEVTLSDNGALLEAIVTPRP